jgi:hypothetical protein
MFGKAERPWRTLRENASAMMHIMSVSNSVWSCAVSTVVSLRNRTFSRANNLSSGVRITLLTSKAPDASKFRISGCSVFAKVSDKLRNKLGENGCPALASAIHMMLKDNVPTTMLRATSPHLYMLFFKSTFQDS